ncbi:hypothetical protein GC163_22580 [bacterium]|nr:hypothetical protein [bacterium]
MGKEVEFHWDGEHLAVIERPEIPYHMVVQEGVAWFGDRVPEIEAVARRLQPKLQPDPKRPLLAWEMDLRQIPLNQRNIWQAIWLQSLSNRLQKRDGESEVSHRWRNYWGEPLQKLAGELAEGVETVRLTLTTEEEEQQVVATLVVQCAAGSPLSRQLSQWQKSPSEWTEMAKLPDAIFAGGLRWDGLGRDRSAETEPSMARADLGWAVFGLALESRVVVFGLSGETRRWFEDLLLPAGTNSIPQSAPGRITVGPEHLWWRRWLQVPATAWITRQGDSRLWLAFGQEEVAGERLLQLSQAFPDWPSTADPSPLALRCSATWLAGVITGQRFAPNDPATSQRDVVTLQIVPSPRADQLRCEFRAPISATRHVSQALISELAALLEQRVQEME